MGGGLVGGIGDHGPVFEKAMSCVHLRLQMAGRWFATILCSWLICRTEADGIGRVNPDTNPAYYLPGFKTMPGWVASTLSSMRQHRVHSAFEAGIEQC